MNEKRTCLDVQFPNTIAHASLAAAVSYEEVARGWHYRGMALGSLDTNSRENTRITLGLLEAVESGNARPKRGLAVDLGTALGLVNVDLERCMKNELVKVSQAPSRRFACYQQRGTIGLTHDTGMFAAA